MIRTDVALRRIDRARHALGRETRYVLGKGGFDPTADLPGRECDCSGFAAWLMQLKRARLKTWWQRLAVWKSSPWIETTNIVKDAMRGNGVFQRLERAEPGAFLVYPDRVLNGKHRQGHIALIESVDVLAGLTVIDCNSTSWRVTGDAIRRHTGNAMTKMPGAIVVCLKQDLKS